jgi:hypothetical protein
MPAKQCVRSHNSCDLAQLLTAQSVRPRRESAPVVIGQLKASAPQLAAKNAILFEEIAKDVPLLAIKPAGQHGEQQLERGGIDHEPGVYTTGRDPCLIPADPEVGHYGIARAIQFHVRR